MSQALEKLMDFYRDFSLESLSNLDDIYLDDVVFEDPIHRVEDLKKLKGYFTNTMQGLNYCNFEFTRHVSDERAACLEWKMIYAHRRLKKGNTLVLNGSSTIEFEGDKIKYQRDYYDMGEMIYEYIPLLGAVLRRLKNRLVV